VNITVSPGIGAPVAADRTVTATVEVLVPFAGILDGVSAIVTEFGTAVCVINTEPLLPV
jgi:hypothetical protein